MDKVDLAARILARAFGYGRAWDTRYTYGDDEWLPSPEATTAEVVLGDSLEEVEPCAVSDGLSVCRETETLQRARDSVSAWLGREDAQAADLTREQVKARATLTDAQMRALWTWERAHPLTRRNDRSPYRPREFEHWKRTRAGRGVQVVRPMHGMNQCALEALAGIERPLQATLLVYALQDGSQWPTVERYARAVLPKSAHKGIPEGMYRLLKEPSKRTRAKELRMRVIEWDAMSAPALGLFESWVERAAGLFLQQLERQPRVAGSQSSGHRTETWWRPPACP
jgi:hypothetical protein